MEKSRIEYVFLASYNDINLSSGGGKMEQSSFLTTIEEAYTHNWVVTLELKREKTITGIVNTQLIDNRFYLTHHGDVEQFNLADLKNVKVLDQKWWQTPAEN